MTRGASRKVGLDISVDDDGASIDEEMLTEDMRRLQDNKTQLFLWSQDGGSYDALLRVLAKSECALCLRKCKLGRWLEDNVVARLEEVLVESTELVHLDVSHNKFGPTGARVLAGVPGKYVALVHVDLSWNKLGPEGAGSLAGVLGECPALAHLNLMDNDIGDAGMEKLAGVLPECSALAHLDLARNEIGEDGVGKLADVLGARDWLT